MVTIQKSVIDVLSTLAQGELTLEQKRIVLAEDTDFEVLSAFKYLDSSKSGSISVQDLAAFLPTVPPEQLNFLVKAYDCTGTNSLALNEFSKIVLVSTDLSLRDEVVCRDSAGRVSQALLAKLQDLLETEAVLQFTLEHKRQELTRLPGFSLHVAYDSLIQNHTVSFSSISSAFRQYGACGNEENVYALLKRLKKNTERGLKYDEFIEGVLPFSEREELPSDCFKYYKKLYTKPILPCLKTSPIKEAKPKLPYVNLSEALLEQVALRLQLETALKELNSLPEFSPSLSFEWFDCENKGFLTQFDIEDALDSLKVPHSSAQIFYLLNAYTANKKLDFPGFAAMICSSSDRLKEGEMTKSVLNSLAKTFHILLKAETHSYKIQRGLRRDNPIEVIYALKLARTRNELSVEKVSAELLQRGFSTDISAQLLAFFM